MVHGYDNNAHVVLGLLQLDPHDVPRFRDAWPDPEANTLVVLTRTGGGNREAYEEENAALAKHPLYVRDYDDEYDDTFALFVFNLPEDTPPMEGLPPATSLREKMESVLGVTLDSDGK